MALLSKDTRKKPITRSELSCSPTKLFLFLFHFHLEVSVVLHCEPGESHVPVFPHYPIISAIVDILNCPSNKSWSLRCAAAMLALSSPRLLCSPLLLNCAIKVKLWSVKLLKVRKPTCGIFAHWFFFPPS